MSTFNKDGRLSTKKFANIPPIHGLPSIIRPQPSYPCTASKDAESDVDLGKPSIREDRCFITGIKALTNEKAHWINAVRRDLSKKRRIESHIDDLGIVPANFDLDSPCNMANIDIALHKALDIYALFAVTGTEETLTKFIAIIKEDNDRRQTEVEHLRPDPGRRRNDWEDVDLQYQVVVLHPRHFLLESRGLPTYDSDTGINQFYYATDAGVLQTDIEDPSTSRPPFPGPRRIDSLCPKLEPLLVIMNAEIKFRRYLRQKMRSNLNNDVKRLILLTLQLVDLIYWRPVRAGGLIDNEIPPQSL